MGYSYTTGVAYGIDLGTDDDLLEQADGLCGFKGVQFRPYGCAVTGDPYGGLLIIRESESEIELGCRELAGGEVKPEWTERLLEVCRHFRIEREPKWLLWALYS